MPSNSSRILILGGTEEARLLAARLAEHERFHGITSLAGRTRTRNEVAGEVRVGGFGGADGLRAYLEEGGISLLVDATHPFATRISANAAEAGEAAGVACLRLERPPWEREAGDNWTEVKSVEAAAKAIPAGARALVTVGRQELKPFFARDDVHLVARMIEPPDIDVPGHAEILCARPPFALEQERALMTERDIGVLVSKNSGGDATYAKVRAARDLKLPVIMVDRPEKPPLLTAASVDEMMAVIEHHFA